MAYTYDPNRYIPLADAFGHLCHLSSECVASVVAVNQAANNDDRAAAFEKCDQAQREIERNLRAALADGTLHAFISTANGQIEVLIDRDGWRQEAFGIPGIENVPHPVTSPGPDTDGGPIILDRRAFETWLKQSVVPLSTRRRGRLPSYDWPDAKAFAKKLVNDKGQFNEWDSEWRGQADLERAVFQYMTKNLADGGPSESVVRSYVAQWLDEWMT